MEMYLLESIKMENQMVKGNMNGKMEVTMKEILYKVLNKDLENGI